VIGGAGDVQAGEVGEGAFDLADSEIVAEIVLRLAWGSDRPWRELARRRCP